MYSAEMWGLSTVTLKSSKEADHTHILQKLLHIWLSLKVNIFDSLCRHTKICLYVCFWSDSRQWATASSFTRFVFLDHTQRHTAVGRTPLDEWSARRRDLYLTTHNTHNRQTSMPPVGFEPISYALYRAVTGVCHNKVRHIKYTQHSWYSCTQLHTQHLKPDRDRVRPFSFPILRKSEKFVAGKDIPNYRTYISTCKSSCTRHSAAKTMHNLQTWKHRDLLNYSATQNLCPYRSVSLPQYTDV